MFLIFYVNSSFRSSDIYILAYAEKRIDKKAKVNFQIYDVTDCTTNNFDKYIAQYLKKKDNIRQ